MALKHGQFDGGTTAAKVSTVIGYTRQDFYEVEITADSANTGDVFLGPSTVASDGSNATRRLDAGESVKLGPIHGGVSFQVDLTALYVVGSAASQKCYVWALTADGRRIPLQR